MKTKSLTKKALFFLITGIVIVIQLPLDSSASSLDSLSTVVKMQERDVTVTVYYYAGEEEWGQHIFDITVEALPILEDLAGFPYPHDFDVVIYPKRSEETSMWNAQNLMEKGIWINRDRFTPEIIKYWSITAVIIHENVHYWSNDAIYGKPWLKEGYAELFAYLTLEKMGKKEDALHRKNEWSRTVEENSYYNIPLDKFEYEAAGPGNETTLLAYSKSALFCYEIYEKYGLAPIKKINNHLIRNGISADSFTYMTLLEEYTGENQKELFMEWVFPKRIDLEEWQNAQEKIHELEELTDSSLSYIEQEYGLSKVMDFVEFHVNVITLINTAQSYIKEYEFERAAQIIKEEIEEINKVMSEFDVYALRYFEAEEYYNSFKLTLEEPHHKLLAARESLLTFKYDLFTEQLTAFYEEMEKLETYQGLYNQWCTGESCTSLHSLYELLSHKSYEEVISTVEKTVTVITEYEATEKELANSDWFTRVGLTVLKKSVENFEHELENAREEIKNGNCEDATGTLTLIRGELLKARRYGIGIVLCGAFVVVSVSISVLVMSKKEKKILQP